MKTPAYRKPTFYLAPYNYCDRWCERCTIDKTKCEIYQMEMNDRLHHIADGVDPDAPEVVAADIGKNFSAALALLHEKAKEMGIDLDKVEIPPEEKPKRRPEDDPRVARCWSIGKGISEFIDEHRADLVRDFREPYEILAFYRFQPGAKFARIQRFEEEDDDARMVANSILSMQIAHKGLVAMLQALLAILEKRPAWRDGVLDTMARLQAVAKEIEEQWLSKPCGKLTAVKKGEPWWGPLKE